MELKLDYHKNCKSQDTVYMQTYLSNKSHLALCFARSTMHSYVSLHSIQSLPENCLCNCWYICCMFLERVNRLYAMQHKKFFESVWQKQAKHRTFGPVVLWLWRECCCCHCNILQTNVPPELQMRKFPSIWNNSFCQQWNFNWHLLWVGFHFDLCLICFWLWHIHFCHDCKSSVRSEERRVGKEC